MTREEAINVLNMVEAHGPLVIEAKEIAMEALKQPELKKGKWIKNKFYENALQCSNCDAYLDKEDWSRHYFYFCYHCGAFMEGMETEE